MEVHFCCVATGKEMKHLRKFAKDFLSYHSVDIIVFDGYAPVTRDAINRNRSGTFSEIVEIKNNNPCKTDRSTFFSNYINKANFVIYLAEKLHKNGFNVIQYPMNADTKIIITALTVTKDSPVNVFVDDTDILSLLIHHMTNSSTHMYKIYITNVKRYKEGNVTTSQIY